MGLVVVGRTYDFADTEVFGRLFWWLPGVPHDVPPGWTDGARVIVKLVHKPAAPGGLTATPSYDEGYPTVALDWNDPGDPMVGGYELRMKKGSDAWGEWQEIQLRDIQRSGNRWSYLAGRRWPGAENAPESLDPGAAYTFEVRARNEGGTGPAAQQTATTLGDATSGEHGDLHISRSSDTLHEGGAITYTLSRPSANAPATIGFYLNYPYSFKGLISSDDFPAAGESGHPCDDHLNDYDCFTFFGITLPASDAVSPQRPQTRQLRIQYKSSGNYVARAVAGGSQGVGVRFEKFDINGFTEYYKTRISGLGTTFPFTIEPDNPGAPAGLSATAGDGEVTLAWDRLLQKHRARGTRYEYRVTPPSTADWAEIPDSSSVTDGYAVTGLTGGTSYVFEVRVAHTNGWKGPSSEVRETPSESPGEGMRATVEFGATFHDLPAGHDGETPFTFELRFTEDVEGLSSGTLRDHAFEVANGGGEGRAAPRAGQQPALGDHRRAGRPRRRGGDAAGRTGLRRRGGRLHGRRPPALEQPVGDGAGSAAGPADGGVPRPAVRARRGDTVHLRAAFQRGRRGPERQDAPRRRLHGDQRAGEGRTASRAGQQPALGDHRRAGRRRGHRDPAAHGHGLRGGRRGVHCRRQAARGRTGGAGAGVADGRRLGLGDRG